MSAHIINILDHLSADKQEVLDAVVRALNRPFLVPQDRKGNSAATQEYIANWLIQGLWGEGFRIVSVEVENEED